MKGRAAVALLLAACGTRDRTATLDGLTTEQSAAIASAWRSPAMLAVQERAACDTVQVGIAQASCGASVDIAPATLATLSASATAIAARARDARSPALLRTLALVDAATASRDTVVLDRAVASIETAVQQARDAATDVGLQVDRAALHLQRHALRHDVPDLLAALDASAQAAAHAPSNLPACWNRALALTWLGMRNTAARAWPVCARLSRDAGAPHLVDAGSALPEGAREVAMSGRWLEAAQEYAWTTILPRWGRSVRLAHADSAAIALRELDSVITMVRRQPSDSSLLRVRRDIAATGGGAAALRLARAFELYGGAKLAYALASRGRVPDAVDTALQLMDGGAELRRWARLKRAAGLITAGHAREARDTIRMLRRATVGERSLFAMRAFHNDAVTQMALGDTRTARAMFAEVGAACEALSLERCRASSVKFVAEMSALLGDDAGEQRAALSTLDAIARSPASALHWSAMETLRHMAVVRGHVHAAALLGAEAGSVAVLIHEPGLSLEGVMLRAIDHIEAGDTAALARDLDEARRTWLPRLPADERDWAAPDLLQMEGELVRPHDPRHSVQLLDSALALLGTEENALRRAQLVYSRARSALAAGDSATALHDLDDLLQLVGARVGTESSLYERVRLGRVLSSVARLSGGILRQRGDVRRAYAALSGQHFAAAAPLPGVMRVIGTWRAMRQVGDSVWIWSPSGDSVRLRVVPVPARYAADAAALDSAALTRLYDLLLRGDSALTSAVSQPLHLDVRGPLAAVPWGALFDTQRRRYLVELVPIVLSDGTPRALSHGATLAFRTAVLVDAASGTTRASLPGAVGEIDTLAALWRERAQRVDARRGATYTLAQLAKAGTIHFAGHAILDRQLPERSYLALPAPRDSVITATQILARSFRGVQLVVLAGCDTRGFPLNDQGGFDSLAGAFLSAGAAAVIGSGWRVDDASTATLMQWLHAALLSGQAPADALRSAQVAAIRSTNPTMRSPRMWAAFQVMGS